MASRVPRVDAVRRGPACQRLGLQMGRMSGVRVDVTPVVAQPGARNRLPRVPGWLRHGAYYAPRVARSSGCSAADRCGAGLAAGAAANAHTSHYDTVTEWRARLGCGNPRDGPLASRKARIQARPHRGAGNGSRPGGRGPGRPSPRTIGQLPRSRVRVLERPVASQGLLGQGGGGAQAAASTPAASPSWRPATLGEGGQVGPGSAPVAPDTSQDRPAAEVARAGPATSARTPRDRPWCPRVLRHRPHHEERNAERVRAVQHHVGR